MPVDPSQTIYFRQARFSTRLPKSLLYAPSHYWVREVDAGVFQVGMTRFATRMLGDFVELNFDCDVSTLIEAGQPIGSIEGFKAVSDVYSAVTGEFLGGNAALLTQPEQVDRDPYDRGWLYSAKGRPSDDVMSAEEYVELLQRTIDRMLALQASEEKKNC